jgi:hypothetical protein
MTMPIRMHLVYVSGSGFRFLGESALLRASLQEMIGGSRIRDCGPWDFPRGTVFRTFTQYEDALAWANAKGVWRI